jgi:hypothetical protein
VAVEHRSPPRPQDVDGRAMPAAEEVGHAHKGGLAPAVEGSSLGYDEPRADTIPTPDSHLDIRRSPYVTARKRDRL